MRDNDSNYHKEFDDVSRSAGVQIERNTPRSPNLRAHVGLFIQTLKFEALNKFEIVARRHLKYINSEFHVHYNRDRPREAPGNLPPDWRMIETKELLPADNRSRLREVLISYHRRAA